MSMSIRGSRKFCQRGSKFLSNIFLVVRGREDPNTTISRLSSARQRNAIKMAFHWRADGGPTLNAAIKMAWQICDFSGDPDQQKIK